MKIKVGIILGSGLNKFTCELSNKKLLSVDKNGFHKIKVISGRIQNTGVVLFTGRKHFYEGYTTEDILKNVSTAFKLGVRLLVITNAAGGLNPSFLV